MDVYATTCYGTELHFKYNVYHVASADVKELERDAKEEGKIEVARSMRAEGLSIDVIKKCTGLDREDILSLG